LEPLVLKADHLIIHNVLTKHFNLALSVALCRLLEAGSIAHGIAWCHDFTWTSPHSRSKVHPGYPWDVLRTYRDDLTYVTVSKERQRSLAGLLSCPPEKIKVIYNGVDPGELLGLSAEGADLIERLGLLSGELHRWRHASGIAHGPANFAGHRRYETARLNLLLPVRVTQAKNIEFAIQVLAALKDRGRQARLVVSGPPDPHDAESMAYYRSLLDLRDRLGVTNEVHFVYQSGPDPDEGYTIDSRVVGDLYRVSDALFMPSHREGFGMPVLEAGLAGLPIFCTAFPAAVEIGGEQVHLIDVERGAEAVAGEVLYVLEGDPQYRLRRRVRQSYTWGAILQDELIPLLEPPAR
jgi:glycosyltransferase involved in cell wall biosynthesis